MLQENISLREYNTFGIDALARYFAAFSDIQGLQELLQIKLPVNRRWVLGGGSNILVTKNVDGLVLKNELMGISTINEDDAYIYVKAGAGENWHRFVLYCLEKNYAGVENLALIPGNVGASPMQNIGAYGVEIKDVFYSLEAIDIHTGEPRTFDKAECGFGYRESVFKNIYRGQYIITAVTYQLLKKPVFHTSYGALQAELDKMNITSLTIRNIAQAVINIRSSKLPDPAVLGNAGSFFKNPEVDPALFNELKNKHPGIIGFPQENGQVKLAAGWLIEQCGWKGYRRGDAGCHARQALVLVNYGQASGEDIFRLSEDILQSVIQKFSVRLEREVNIL